MRLLSLLVSVLALNTVGLAIDPVTTTHIFIQTAKSGTCKPREGRVLEYTIKFKDVEPTMLFYSNFYGDRAQMVATKDFAKAWKRNKTIGYFKTNPATGVMSLSCTKFKDMFTFDINDITYDDHKKKLILYVKLVPLQTQKRPPVNFEKVAFNISNPSEYNEEEGDSWGALGG